MCAFDTDCDVMTPSLSDLLTDCGLDTRTVRDALADHRASRAPTAKGCGSRTEHLGVLGPVNAGVRYGRDRFAGPIGTTFLTKCRITVENSP